MARILRGVSGQYAGAVFVLGSVTSIGRAADVDLQLVDPRVSRQHAKIIVDGSTMVLLDLASKNGTSVGNARVVRHVLSAGDMVCIGESTFVFEESASAAQTDLRFGRRVRTIDALRQTVVDVNPHVSVPTPTKPAESVFDPTRLIAEALAEEVQAATEALGRQPVVESKNASLFTTLPRTDDELLQRILDFRALRLRYLRGEHLRAPELEHFQSLRRALRYDEKETARQYLRFACDLQAQLVVPVRERVLEQHGSLLDISAGGARLRAMDRGLRIGQQGWLSVGFSRAGRRHSVVLDARVVWMSSPRAQLGLMFSGEARSGTGPAAV